MDSDWLEKLSNGLLITALVLMILMIPICIVNVVVSIRSAIKGVDPTKTTMTVKLCLIPWYALNFFIGYVFVSIFLNPFMMIAIPVIIALLVASTYILMLSTSVGDIAYLVRTIVKKDRDVRPSMIIAGILLFIFCLDVVGAIILYCKSQKTPTEEQINTPTE